MWWGCWMLLHASQSRPCAAPALRGAGWDGWAGALTGSPLLASAPTPTRKLLLQHHRAPTAPANFLPSPGTNSVSGAAASNHIQSDSPPWHRRLQTAPRLTESEQQRDGRQGNGGKSSTGLRRSPKRLAGWHCQLPGTTEPRDNPPRPRQATHGTRLWPHVAPHSHPCTLGCHTPSPDLPSHHSPTGGHQRLPPMRVQHLELSLCLFAGGGHNTRVTRGLELFALAGAWSDVLPVLSITDPKRVKTSKRVC